MKSLKLASLCAGAALCAASAFGQVTMNSPTGAPLPGAVSVVGGIVLDLVGTNNNRVVSQLAASSLFVGFYDDGTPVGYRGNPGTIGIQTGFDASILSALGGGLSKAAVRFTLYDGDSSAGDFDEVDNTLLLNGVDFGNWGAVSTVTHNSTGTSFTSSQLGFTNDELVTGFFYSNNADTLAKFYATLTLTNQVIFQVNDSDPYDNFYDFTQGIDAGLINVGTGPIVSPPTSPVPEPSTYGMVGAAALAGLVWFRRRQR
jgi:hypothetical protein